MSIDLQGAIDAAWQDGGEIEVPSGVHELQAGLIFRHLDPYPDITPNITLRGHGLGNTTIKCYVPGADLLTIARSNVHFKGINFQGSQLSQGGGRGIVINDPVNGVVLRDIHMEDCRIQATEREALYVPTGWPHLLAQPLYDRISILCTFNRCWFQRNLVPGSDLAYIGKWNTLYRFTECTFTDFKGRGLFLNGADTTSCRDCVFEGGDNTAPYVEARETQAGLLDHCYFEDDMMEGPRAVFVKTDRYSRDHGWAAPNCTYRSHR
jgi:hypothetical protein